MIDFDEKKKQDEYREQLLSFVPSTAEEYLIKDLDLTKIALCEALETNETLKSEIETLTDERDYNFQKIVKFKQHIINHSSFDKQLNNIYVEFEDYINCYIRLDIFELMFGKEITHIIKNKGNEDE